LLAKAERLGVGLKTKVFPLFPPPVYRREVPNESEAEGVKNKLRRGYERR